MKLRRHALLVGIDTYPGFGADSLLAGAVHDVRAMADVLIQKHRFAEEDVHLLLNSRATRSGILSAMAELRQRVRGGDQVLFFFSGHGSQMTDREGDEGDGLDETLVAYDSGRGEAENRDITDDEINHWAAQILALTPHLSLIFDCCHAATLHRSKWRARSLPPDLRSIENLPPSPLPLQRDTVIGPRPLMIAACRDLELALEIPGLVIGKARGAFSYHLIEALRESAAGEETWREVFRHASYGLRVDSPEQHPQLSGDGLDRRVFHSARGAKRGDGVAPTLLSLASQASEFGLSMTCFSSSGGAWRRAAGLRPRLRVGDRLRVDIRHSHSRELYVYLFDLGLTDQLTLLFPDREGHEALDPGLTLSVGNREGDLMQIALPEDLPSGHPKTLGSLVLAATEVPTSTYSLLSAPSGEGRGILVWEYRLFLS